MSTQETVAAVINPRRPRSSVALDCAADVIAAYESDPPGSLIALVQSADDDGYHSAAVAAVPEPVRRAAGVS